MVAAIFLDYGHTIIDFAAGQRVFLAAYHEAVSLIADCTAGDASGATASPTVLAGGILAQVGERYRREELADLDILQLFELQSGAQVRSELRLRLTDLTHRALAAESYLPPEHSHVLRDLRAQGLSLALVSNLGVRGDLVREELDALGLLDLFDAVILASELGVPKPHPAIYMAALQALKVSASDSVFVGARLREDIEGAHLAGMRAVLTQQFRHEEPVATIARPDAVIRRLSELPAAVRQLREAQ